MNITQAFRRIGQKMGGWSDAFASQSEQLALVTKLYKKHGLGIKGGGACPEQYDIFRDGKQVAYYRLRHGEFRIDMPDCGDETIYDAEPDGDGIFESYERLTFLAKAMRQVLSKLNEA